MSDRILCKFFVHGSCLKGENCEYSHDSKHHANNVCTFYQKGICSYGTRCRYEHVRTSQKRDGDHHKALTLCYTHPREHPICSFAAAGDCPRGSQCPHMHGDVCSTCGKKCLHPFRPEEREEHTKECEKKQKHIEALKKSQEIECSVCLDRVLSKATPGERKFGLLTECHHPFCIQCIRNWRSSAPVSGMDVNSTLRACPICRKLSYFVVPSVVWYSSPEEKKEIIDVYKAKLRSIDCKHFNFGNGSCPFGGSCFYKHAYTDGNLEEVVVRHLGSQEGETVIADSVAGLSEFLGRVHL
ncbi:hypothetical protein BRARA_C03243 [Brassica rapa]|uniref:Uncharacterized protein n=2 Tax=Brassica campestris TaxID=3711 RepID=A0A398A0D4_BRACM|nr:E3 ubiquitin-protein ligase makorin [Brassica rapa]XP_013736007.1 E3 ubiquitin-protein ligase makorin [Brassica napus]XP_033142702.1 E3 ubiquitin-protein ligase makorin [Brassica rapa]XP_033142703.1 E3 ubiquitin-protein ligase makorin [Brassica rapa]XP_033142704.1 E3 ubiquitin-protein ligase makorin [Brassica rapa]RID71299.1 hypothetical protein BRARA_C03243 [Brassica rapa]